MFEPEANTDLFIAHSPALPRSARAHTNTRLSYILIKFTLRRGSFLRSHIAVCNEISAYRTTIPSQAPLSLTGVLKLSDYGNIKMSVGLM